MKLRLGLIIVMCLMVIGVGGNFLWQRSVEISGAPPYGEPESAVPDMDPYAWMREWKRPDGPVRVGVQVGIGRMKNCQRNYHA